MEDKVKVYTPEVLNDSPFPSEQVTDQSSTEGNSKVYTPTETIDNPLPDKKIAYELISNSLNTQSRKILDEFQFTRMGAIQIGSYEEDETGDIRISPDGIVGRNNKGETTFSIDGDTGDATFKGIVRAGSLVSGDIVLGGRNNGDGTMTIADASGNEIIIGDKLGHHYYDTSGNELIRVDWEGLKAYGNAGNPIKIYPTAGVNPFFVMGYNVSSNYVSLTTLNGGGDFTTGRLHLASYKGPSIDIGYGVVNQDILIYTYSDSDIYLTSNSVIISGDLIVDGVIDGSVSSADYATNAGYATTAGNATNANYATNAGYASNAGFADSAYGAYMVKDLFDTGEAVGIYLNGGVIKITHTLGITKTAIVPTSQGLKTLYCTESPEVWFMDFYKSEEKPDPLFLEVTKAPYHKITCDDGFIQIWGIRKDVSEERFATKTKEEYSKNNEFWKKAKIDDSESKKIFERLLKVKDKIKNGKN